MFAEILSWDVVRVVNLVLAMSAVTLLVMGTISRWPVMPLAMRRLVPWIIATYTVIAYGSGEALANDVQPGLRIVLMCLSLIGLIVALLYNLSHKDNGGYDPPPPGVHFLAPKRTTERTRP